MKDIFKKIFSTIFCIIAYTALLVYYFVENFHDANLQKQDIPYMILFYIGLLILVISIRGIFSNMNNNTKIIMLKKYQIFIIFKKLEENQKLSQFEEYCVDKNNLAFSKSVSTTKNTLNVEEFERIIKFGTVEEIKEFLVNYDKTTRKKLKSLIQHYNKPCFYDYFVKYYENTILRKDNTAKSFLMGFVSIILAVVPLFNDAFRSISIEAYCEFLPLLIAELTLLFISRKERIQELYNNYSEDYKNLKQEYDCFINNQK